MMRAIRTVWRMHCTGFLWMALVGLEGAFLPSYSLSQMPFWLVNLKRMGGWVCWRVAGPFQRDCKGGSNI